MTVLAATGAARPEPLLETLAGELEAHGADVAVPAVAGERPMALIGGVGWAACARLLAAGLATGERLDGPLAIVPHPDGWSLSAGGPAMDATPARWTELVAGELVYVGHIVAAAGGSARLSRLPDGRLHVVLVVPAAPSSG